MTTNMSALVASRGGLLGLESSGRSWQEVAEARTFQVATKLLTQE